MSRLLLFLILTIATGMTAVQASAEETEPVQTSQLAHEVQSRLGSSRSFALLIGISKYQNFADLPWVQEDIGRVRLSLSNAGFQVFEPPILEGRGSLTVAQLRTYIREFVGARTEDDRTVIYIATHGYSSASAQDASRPGFIVGTDTESLDGNFEATAYSVSDLGKDLQPLKSRHLFLIINACFSGGFAKRQEAVTFVDSPSNAATDRSDPYNSWILSLLQKKTWLVLTAGSDTQPVPDENSPFGIAVSEGLLGAADGNGDGFILGSELASYVRGIVGPRTHALGRPNDPFFASLLPSSQDSPDRDFVFASPIGPRSHDETLRDPDEAITAERNAQLERTNSFTECGDCPVMVEVQTETSRRIAFARTETTYLEWSACYRELGCSRYLGDGGESTGSKPAGGISWLDALEFVTWLDKKRRGKCGKYRIPTTAEWTHAAVAGRENRSWRYPWGDEFIHGRAVCAGCGPDQAGDGPMPVASFLPNANGLYDMAGNLWEWTYDPLLQCNAETFLAGERTCEPTPVMGGSFATRVKHLSIKRQPTAALPRTGPTIEPDGRPGFSLETVGLRVACDMN